MDNMNSLAEFDIKKARGFFSRLGLVFVLGSILSFGIQYIASLVLTRCFPDYFDTLNNRLIGLMAPTFLVAYPLFLLAISRIPKGKPLEQKRMTIGQLSIAFLMAYSLMYICSITGVILSIPKYIIDHTSVINPVAEIVLDSSPLIQMVIMVILAPVFEELIFRKFLIDRAVRYGQGAAVIISGLMFALFHGNLSQALYAFCIGLLFGFIYVRTGRIRYPIILHCVINFIGSVLSGEILKLLNYEELTTTIALEDTGLLISYLSEHIGAICIYMLYTFILQGIVIAGFVLLLVRRRHFKLNRVGIQIPKGLRFRTICINPGMLIYIIGWIGVIIYSYIFD